MAEFGLHHVINNKTQYNGLLSLSDGSDDILLSDANGNNGTRPSISLYWQQNFARKQMIVVNFNSSFYSGHSFSA